MRELLDPLLAAIAERHARHALLAEAYGDAQRALQQLAQLEDGEAAPDGADSDKSAEQAAGTAETKASEAVSADKSEPEPDTEELVCQRCGDSFTRPSGMPGAKPRHCPQCRDNGSWPVPRSTFEPPVVGNGERACTHCAEPFVPTQDNQRFCSRTCKKAQREHAAAEQKLGTPGA